MLDRAAIAARIPHQGAMCLLDAVLDWHADAIRCTSTSHRDPANPLSADGRLGIAAGIEYAAQAMALHGGLIAAGDTPPRQGYLVSVRGVSFHTLRLDDRPDALLIEAERLSGDANQVLYAFRVSAAGTLLLDGRAAVVLDASSLEPTP
ncbi:3-hydroxylacyl-ACP dehydratase [Zoogloea sp.]|uniref:3-hydroxylacyl-ACP dehydratase n=1 Tax=Zoogloea sp. TaxID=49181 RepID=UPI0035AD8C9E